MDYNRPEIEIPKTPFEKLLELISVLIIFVTFIYIMYVWKDLPENMPMHFNAFGEPDAWGPKASIFMLPVMSTFLFVLLFLLAKIPSTHNFPIKVTEQNAKQLYELSKKMLVIMNFEIVCFFSFATWSTVQVAFGKAGLGSWFLPALIIVLFGTMLYMVIKIVRLRNK
ncbi:putative membrane protein [Salirhabdus euzebyi]|uniref:Putative membrane protein n=1 Tax=Salirhabdus euzebyi TaxID=394506 RepID=A0A841Q8L8_9BACI|nr:DUF1648 domain-containing protein [Salirhabdus euzebyi]MBB6454622.1 putative membrane protein [Salirhabdus euzebyi]